MSNTAKIATLLPIYKDDDPVFLDESLTSILNQTWSKYHIIILIDGVVPESIIEIINKYKNLILLKYPVNRGLAAVLNDGIKYCFKNKYNYIARMDADDIAYPDRFEKQISFLLNHTEVDVVGGAIEEIDEFGRTRNKIISYPQNHADCYKYFQKRDPLAHPAVMFRKSFFEKAGLYNDVYRKNQDTMLWFQGFMNGCKFANIPNAILKFRINKSFFNSRRSGWKRAKKMLQDRFIINRALNYGLKGNIYALGMFIITISPSFVRIIAYKILR